MSRAFYVLTTIFFIFLAISVFGGMLWGNTLYARDHPGETDFFVPWLSAQTFLRYGDPSSPDNITPYSDPATQRTQVVYYGRVVADDEDPLILWLPFPAELFYFPFALISDYALARGLWMTLSEIALVASAFASLRLFRWKLPHLLLLLALLFPVLWIFGMPVILSAGPLPFVLLAAVCALLALRAGQDELAGILLVFPTLKLGIFSLFVFFLLWWALYHRRGRLLAGFGMAAGLLLLISFLVLPGWVMPFLRGLYWHIQFTPPVSTYSVLGALFPVAGPRFALLLTFFWFTVVFFEFRDARHRDFRHILWTACLMLVVAPLIGLPLGWNDFSAFLLPTFLFLAVINERWPRRRWLGFAPAALLLILVFGWTLSLTEGLTLFFSLLLVLGLYWVRWYAVRPPRTLLELEQ